MNTPHPQFETLRGDLNPWFVNCGLLLGLLVWTLTGCDQASWEGGDAGAGHGGSAAIPATSEAAFPSEVLASETPVLVDFYADWCGPCRIQGRMLEELAAERPDLKIVKLDVDDSPNLARQYNVQSIPTLIVFQGGQIVGRRMGVTRKRELLGMLGE